MSTYAGELARAMNFLTQDSRTICLSQAVAVAGNAMRNMLEGVSPEKLVEFPIKEDFRMGVSIGMLLRGRIPISIFLKWNYLLLSSNQFVNDLDSLKRLTPQDNPPKVMIRTGIGSESPLHPGPQHTGDFTKAFRQMCRNINIVRLDKIENVFDSYWYALERTDGISTILV
jgi:pyruvate/2-oxoglutarate/acetoin dehydrogenase E1 component